MTGDQAGQLLELVRTGKARTRRELLEVTGLSRSTITARIEQLVRAGYLRESGVESGARGRPSAVLAFDDSRGTVLAAELGATHARVAVCDLAGRVVGELFEELRIASGPEVVLGWLENQWRHLLAVTDRDPEPLVGFGVGVPGPVDVGTGRTFQPPIMPGWHDYPIRQRLEESFGVPGFVENDANAMAFGEYHAAGVPLPSLLFVKVATGIGAGMVIDGRVVRGADGGSGDIGHVRVSSPGEGPLCACGARGCLAAWASGSALARRLQEEGFDAATSLAAVDLALAGEAQAVTLVREAGLMIGDVLATAVSLLNPRALVLGGDLAKAQDHFIGAVRERIYQRTQPLATRALQVRPTALDDRAGVLGLARLVLEEVFSAESVDRALAAGAAPAGRRNTHGREAATGLRQPATGGTAPGLQEVQQ